MVPKVRKAHERYERQRVINIILCMNIELISKPFVPSIYNEKQRRLPTKNSYDQHLNVFIY